MKKETFLEQFHSITKHGLPGESAHIELLPTNRPLSSQIIGEDHLYRNSAVAVLLFEKNGSIHTALIQRPEYDGTHSKQIAFPGGKMDDTDPDLEFTARRESYEEISLPHGHGELITELSTIYIPVSKFKVYPFVFFLDDEPVFVPDQREVQEVFTFDVLKLKDDSIIKRTDLRLSSGLIRKNIPYFDINGKVVWGATALMLSEMRSILKSFRI